jgi:hypothetical protein
LAKPLGIPVFAWGYCYGDTYGNLAKEISAVIDAKIAGAAGYIINAEKEWEVPQGRVWASHMMFELGRILPDFPLAYYPYWNTRWHGMYPAKEFSSRCVAVLPQAYFMLGKKDSSEERADMLRKMYEDYGAFGLPVYPVGQFCGFRDGKWDPQETEGTMDFIKKIGPDIHHSLWLLDGQVPEMEYRGINLTALEAMKNIAEEVITIPVSEEDADPLIAALLGFVDNLQTALSKLRDVLKSM